VTLEARIAREPERWSHDRTRLVLAAERLLEGEELRPVTGLIQVTLYGIPPPLTSGQNLRGEFRLHRPIGFRNPGSFDYPAHLAREGITLVGSGRADRVTPLTEARPSWPVRTASWIVHEIQQHLPPASAALLAGLLIGERTDLPSEMQNGFRRAGVYHILAVSGFNVALIAGSVFFGLAIVRVPRRIAAAVAILILIAFAIIVGGQPSVVRATIMGVLFLLSVVLDRMVNPLNSLAAAVLAILFWRPQDLWEPGFQLSFAATLGILALTGRLTEWFAQARCPRWLGSAVAVSVSAQLFVTPIMVTHFHQLSLIGLAANLVVVPLAAVATTLGMIAVVGTLISQSAAHWLFESLWLILVTLRWIVFWIAQVPMAMIHLPAFPTLVTIAFYALLASLLFLGRHRMVRVLAGGLAAVVLTAVLVPWLTPPDGRLRLTIIDVGQGDAIFLSLPDGHTMLIDGGPGGGPRFDVGEHVVAPFLWEQSVRRLDALVMTHPDLDHAGGLPAILRHFHVREFWGNRVNELPDGLARLLEQSGTVRRALQRGERIQLGPAQVTVLNPASPPLQGSPRGPASDENSNSLGLRLDWKKLSILLTADIEAEGEGSLIHSTLPLSAEVLKVGHHGSRFSTTPTFLNAVRPSVALISVGARNPFRHPAHEVLGRLEAAGARTYRTDQDGAILLESDGERLTIVPWVSRQSLTLTLDPERRRN
jgi:competence protein ComEC